MSNPPVFRHFYLPGADTERVEILTDWPDETTASRQFVETVDARWVQRSGRTLSFTLSNGSAVYRMASCDSATETYVLRRVG